MGFLSGVGLGLKFVVAMVTLSASRASNSSRETLYLGSTPHVDLVLPLPCYPQTICLLPLSPIYTTFIFTVCLVFFNIYIYIF